MAVTKSALVGRLYVNGVQVGQNTNISLYPARLGNTPNNWIGRSQYLDGELDDFRIYQRGLSAEEVASLAVVSTSTPGDVGGTVPATLSLTLGAPATFGPFTPGVDREYTATTTANVLSTAGDAALTVSDPCCLTNGAFSLPEPLQALRAAPGAVRVQSSRRWAPNRCGCSATTGRSRTTLSRSRSASTWRRDFQPLRTGAYAKPLTFTLATSMP